jgi:hypothetical protein
VNELNRPGFDGGSCYWFTAGVAVRS